ncbi:MAG: CoA-binding protein, partial [Pseudomonadota bacterium]
MMDDKAELIRQIDELFRPESIAIVGLPKGMKTGKLYLLALVDQGYPGKIYPVNPNAEEIDGFKCYPSVSAIPDKVDLAIVLVQNSVVLPVVQECAAKGVKGVVLFTAGGKELGTEDGRILEEELVGVARKGGLRLLGPNCMGFYNPRTGLSFFPGLSKKPGSIGVISHSGSLANILGRLGDQHGLSFSKMISLGNEADLSSADLLFYLGQDPETCVISAYLEGIKDGPYFLQALKKASLEKPVILWKVGLTPEGGRAAASHTGAMAGSSEVWEGVIRQTGAIPVAGWEKWLDAMMGFHLLPELGGGRLAIVSGPGGLAVSAAEACGTLGLRLAELSSRTKARLAECLPPTGTSLKNPIDVSLTAHLDNEIYFQTVRAVSNDPGVDALVIMGGGIDEKSTRVFTG